MNRIQQQKDEVWAANLLFLALLLEFIASGLYKNSVFSEDSTAGYGEKARAALAILVVVGTVFSLRKGHPWAKVLLVLYFAAAVALVAYFHFAAGIPLEFHRIGLAAGSRVAQWLLQSMAFLLIIRSLKPSIPRIPQTG